jgi:hypothetical protein
MWITTTIFFWRDINLFFNTLKEQNMNPKKGGKSRGKIREMILKGTREALLYGGCVSFIDRNYQ